MTVEIPLTQGFVAVVDEDDAELVTSAGKWHVARRATNYYAERTVRVDGRRKTLGMHTLITGWSLTDHIDGDGLNNCRANLREAEHAQDMRNCRKPSNNTSGYKGVSYDRERSKWTAHISDGTGKTKYLGRFSTALDAAVAYDAAAIELFKSFAQPNFPQAPADPRG